MPKSKGSETYETSQHMLVVAGGWDTEVARPSLMTP
jgi:hypothetical protein